MKKVVRILLAILMVACLALSITACKSECDKGNHVWNDGEVTKSATCAAAGEKTYHCLKCDHGIRTEVIPKLAHTPKDVSVSATCTTAGTAGATECEVCGETIAAGTTVNALGHDFTGVNWTPSQTDATKHERTCKRTDCGYVETAGHTPSQADATKCADCGATIGNTPECQHNYGDWAVSVADPAKHQRICSKCGDVEVADHTPETVEAIPATCTTAGTSAGSKCSDCGHIISGCDPILALTHNFTNQPWLIDETSGHHYQECKNDNCDGRNQHSARFDAWTPCDDDAAKHQRACKDEDCDIIETVAHTPETVEYTAATCTTAGIQAGSKCSDCGYVISGCETIKALGHDYEGAEWTPSTVVAGKHVRTCQREGCDYKDRADHTPVMVPAVAATCTTDGKEAGSKCSVCNYVIKEGAVIDALDHNWEANWSTGNGKHWKECTRAGCNETTLMGEHSYGESDHNLRCTVCRTPRPGTNYVLSYMLDGAEVEQSYTRLADAIAFIAGNQAVNNVLIDVGDEINTLEGLGVVFPAGIIVTIDLHDATYIISSNPVGSAGTQTCGFQILAGSTVTIQNGTITSKAGSGVKMLIQNYANLTLKGVTLDGRNLDLVNGAPNYTLSNNCGTVRIVEKSNIIARTENGVALDVWYNMGGNYPQGVKVGVDSTCTITGTIEYGSAQPNVADLATKATLTLPAGNYNIVFSGNVSECAKAGITVGGQKLAAKYGEWTNFTEATCTTNGSRTHTCLRCGKVVTETLPMLGHTTPTATYVGGHEHEGTCTTCGQTVSVECTTDENDVCTVCGRELYIDKQASVTIDTSEQGYTNEEKISEIVPNRYVTISFAQGTNTSSNNVPKYFTGGTAIRVYSGNTVTICLPSNALGYSSDFIITKITFVFGSSDGTNAITADCGSFNGTVWTRNGGEFDSVTFSVGGSSGNRRFQTITVEYSYVGCNHFYPDEWETVTDETCTEDGEEKRVCLDCGNVDTREIPAHHTLGDWVPAEASSCLDTGKNGHVGYYQCTECDKFFSDAEGTNEIADIVTYWAHSFETVGRVEPTADADGKQSYKHCTVCNRNYQLDGTLITNLDNWGNIPYECKHPSYAWVLVEGEGGAADSHVYECTSCHEAQADKTHSPTAGTWSESGNKHVQSCGGSEGCSFTYAEHNANYATAYTVVDGTYHAQVCQDGCGLVANKHAANLATKPLPTSDHTKHYRKCEDCTFTSTPTAHSIAAGSGTYAGNGQHSGTCACDVTFTAACKPGELDNTCAVCGRIVGSVDVEKVATLDVNSRGTVTLAAGETVNTVIFEINGVTFKFVQSGNSNVKDGLSADGYLGWYKNHTCTISVASGTITKIELTDINNSKYLASSSNPTASATDEDATITYSDNIYTWTGSANEITFTASANQIRFKSLVVTYGSSSICFHDGTLTHIENQTSATCEHLGFDAECYYCTNCGKTFKTQDCKELKDVVITPIADHNLDPRDKRDGNCTDVPYLMDHYYCTVCHKYFDVDDNEIAESSAVGQIDENAHNYVWTALTGDNAGKHQQVCTHNSNHKLGEPEGHTAPEDAWVTTENATQHWKICTKCNAAFDHEEHESGCEKCGEKSFTINTAVKVGDADYDGDIDIGDIIYIEEETAMTGTSVEVAIEIPSGFELVNVVITTDGGVEILRVTEALDEFTINKSELGSASSVTVTVTLKEEEPPAGPTLISFVDGNLISDWSDTKTAWPTSYKSHTVSGSDLEDLGVTSVVMSNASRQTGTITDRPTLCAKNANQYVTVTAIKEIKAVTFNLTQWGSKTFAKISIEYSTNGTTWTDSEVSITTPASISYTLPSDVNAKYVRLVYIASSSTNTQMGLTSIELTF